jgi:hypothetical protein
MPLLLMIRLGWALPLDWILTLHKLTFATFYSQIAPVLREGDNNRLIMFESVTWTDEFGMPLFDVGFDHAPGGSEFGNQSIFTFHYYSYVNRGDARKYFDLRTNDA